MSDSRPETFVTLSAGQGASIVRAAGIENDFAERGEVQYHFGGPRSFSVKASVGKKIVLVEARPDWTKYSMIDTQAGVGEVTEYDYTADTIIRHSQRWSAQQGFFGTLDDVPLLAPETEKGKLAVRVDDVETALYTVMSAQLTKSNQDNDTAARDRNLLVAAALNEYLNAKSKISVACRGSVTRVVFNVPEKLRVVLTLTPEKISHTKYDFTKWKMTKWTVKYRKNYLTQDGAKLARYERSWNPQENRLFNSPDRNPADPADQKRMTEWLIDVRDNVNEVLGAAAAACMKDPNPTLKDARAAWASIQEGMQTQAIEEDLDRLWRQHQRHLNQRGCTL